MVTAASGPISSAEDRAAETLADVQAWRDMIGEATTEAQALARIYFDTITPPADKDRYSRSELEALRPFAMIWTDPDFGGYRLGASGGGGTSWSFDHGGRLAIEIERDVDSDDLDEDTEKVSDPADVLRKFKNELGLIIASGDADNPGLVELAGQAGYLAARQIELDGLGFNEEEEQKAEGIVLIARLWITWGWGQGLR